MAMLDKMKGKLQKNSVFQDMSLTLIDLLKDINDNQLKLEKAIITMQENQAELGKALEELDKKIEKWSKR